MHVKTAAYLRMDSIPTQYKQTIKISDEKERENIVSVKMIKESYLFIFIEQVKLCVHLTNSAPSIYRTRPGMVTTRLQEKVLCT